MTQTAIIPTRASNDLILYTLDEDHQHFVTDVFNGSSYTAAYKAMRPHVTDDSARKLGSKLAARIDIQNALTELGLQRARHGRIQLWHGIDIAVRVLKDAAAGDDTITRLQFDAAREILDRSGLSARHVTTLELDTATPSALIDFLASVGHADAIDVSDDSAEQG
jgi:hypothetical protein